ncbi:hypothetical protein VaNZ11_002741 [Volvox africanus]|uniref:Uncharacterized protein n=1 Tax=Volvox africanus TaxID=51714 RepID=A0ABQ5RTD7_9CHLO|nr:hypothetical protein VaNZ11_002741 [Volvox africanus]
MVKIINGEIVADDDPRLQQRHQTNVATPSKGPSETQGDGARQPASPGFSLEAPPLQLVPAGAGFLGLPNAVVFGVLISREVIVAAIIGGIFLGWNKIAVAMILYYLFMAFKSRSPTNLQSTATASQQSGEGAGPPRQQQQDWFTKTLRNYLEGPKPRSRARPGTAASGDMLGTDTRLHGAAQTGAALPSGEAAGPGAGWAAFQGRGNKLGGK